MLFRQSKAHVGAFADFVAFTAGVVPAIGARTHGTGMEVGICTSANTPAQCHLHFFASTANAEGGFVNAEVSRMVDPQKLLFRGKAPQHLSSSKVHKGYRAGTTVQKAMYYLLADKIGSIFQNGSAKPFQDRWFLVVVLLLFLSSSSCCCAVHIILHCCCAFCSSVLCRHRVFSCWHVVFGSWQLLVGVLILGLCLLFLFGLRFDSWFRSSAGYWACAQNECCIFLLFGFSLLFAARANRRTLRCR